MGRFYRVYEVTSQISTVAVLLSRLITKAAKSSDWICDISLNLIGYNAGINIRIDVDSIDVSRANGICYIHSKKGTLARIGCPKVGIWQRSIKTLLRSPYRALRFQT